MLVNELVIITSKSSLGQIFFFGYVALSRPTVKCEKTGSVFFFFLMSDLAEEFAKICIQWPKKALVYAFLTAFRPSFPHLETFHKKNWKTQLSHGT